MSYWALDHWAFALVWLIVLGFMLRGLLKGRRLW